MDISIKGDITVGHDGDGDGHDPHVLWYLHMISGGSIPLKS